MKTKWLFYLLLLAFAGLPALLTAQVLSPDKKEISPGGWYVYRGEFILDDPDSEAVIRIAADSKYWLWVNGEMEVFEGGLKRGPNPQDTYCDVLRSVNLKQGKNSIAVLLWYFGKDGFSHRNSDTPGIWFELTGSSGKVQSVSWKVKKHPAFYAAEEDGLPNYRLPESNVGYDANFSIPFCLPGYDDSKWGKPVKVSLEKAGWNKLVERPIPMWRDFGLKQYVKTARRGDTIVATLPYNAQVTPYLKIKAKANVKIDIRTDNYDISSAPNVYAKYITREGEQEYESLGWMNGHQVWYTLPEGVEVIDLMYRETGYDTEFTGSFRCDDQVLNRLWDKAQRTLYITMRDTYMDCPDRERSQWWGDVVNELGEAFYALDENAHLLTRKGIRELMDWQRPDSTIFSPVPAGNWEDELPMQMLASVGYYGFWTYYMGTGDKETIEYIFPKVKKYLHVWKTDEEGLVIPRSGGWLWGDWGEDKDLELLFNLWYIIALDGYKEMADLLLNEEEALWAEALSDQIRERFHAKYWNGNYYISSGYTGSPDDRAQALAVVSRTLPEEFYPVIRSFFTTYYHASPYMEKYVLQALCDMGYYQDAINRMKERFGDMVQSAYSTLWEGWGIGPEGYGGGSYNHAWSGGPLTILSQYIAGIETIEPAFSVFSVNPRLGNLNSLNVVVPLSDNRKIKLDVYKSVKGMRLELEVPDDTRARLHLPEGYNKYVVNREVVNGKGGIVELASGKWEINCK